MNLKDFLRNKEWAIYRINGKTRKIFIDTFFGPMWQEIPKDVEILEDFHLDSYLKIKDYLERKDE